MAAPAFDILLIGCVLNTKIVYTTAEKLTFKALYYRTKYMGYRQRLRTILSRTGSFYQHRQ